MSLPKLPELGERPRFADEMDILRQPANTPRIRADQEQALGAVMNGLSSGLENYAAFLTGSPIEAEDIVQRAFTQLWLHRHNYNPETVTPTGYMMMITRHLSFNHNRGEERKRAAQPDTISLNIDGVESTAGAELPSSDSDPYLKAQASIVFGGIMKAAAEEAVDGRACKIDSCYSELVSLVMAGASPSEIAQAFGITNGNARVRKHRVIQRVRARVGEDPAELFDEAA